MFFANPVYSERSHLSACHFQWNGRTRSLNNSVFLFEIPQFSLNNFLPLFRILKRFEKVEKFERCVCHRPCTQCTKRYKRDTWKIFFEHCRTRSANNWNVWQFDWSTQVSTAGLFFVKFLKQRKSCVKGHHLSPSPFSFTSKLPGAPEGILEKISLFSSGLKITLSTSYNESYHLEFFSSSASIADRVFYFEHAQKSTGSNN